MKTCFHLFFISDGVIELLYFAVEIYFQKNRDRTGVKVTITLSGSYELKWKHLARQLAGDQVKLQQV